MQNPKMPCESVKKQSTALAKSQYTKELSRPGGGGARL